MRHPFGIILFGHTRPLYLADVLESLERQNALQYTHVWLDGHQGRPDVKHKTELAAEVVSNYAVAELCRHNGGLGFRKLILQALTHAVQQFDSFVVLEDDCFPTRNAVEMFREGLNTIANQDDVFSVYGHPFMMAEENGCCTRFQGWGWATTSVKMAPYLDKLIDCYSLTEARYLEFVSSALTNDLIERLDVTPPRLCTHTLTKFFAWDETLALLTAMDGKVHMKTKERAIYNFGASEDASRFKNVDWYRKPPFNMISHAEVWEYY